MKSSSSGPNEAGHVQKSVVTSDFTVPSDFTVEAGELTPTMKIRRSAIEDRYAGTIADLYSPPRNGDAEHLHDVTPADKVET